MSPRTITPLASPDPESRLRDQVLAAYYDEKAGTINSGAIARRLDVSISVVYRVLAQHRATKLQAFDARSRAAIARLDGPWAQVLTDYLDDPGASITSLADRAGLTPDDLQHHQGARGSMSADTSLGLGCPCPECAELRQRLGTLRDARRLPLALRHDNGSPVTVEVGDTTITTVEAWLRLALDGISDNDPQGLDADVRKALAKLVANPPVLNGFGEYGTGFTGAAKLTEKIRQRQADTANAPGRMRR